MTTGGEEKQATRWDLVSADALATFAQAWLQELKEGTPDSDTDIGQAVVAMNFTAPPGTQWQFILAAVSYAETDEQLEDIAAGPLEHLLGAHGDAWIAQIEDQCGRDPKLARTLTGVWQYRMSQEVWARVQVIKERVSDPLAAYRND